MNRLLFILACTAWIVSPGAAQTEFLVNATQDSTQRAPRVARTSSGDYAVVWTGFAQAGPGSGRDIVFQRFSSAGARIGPETLVNTVTAGDQERPAIAMNPSGTMVIAWTSIGPQDTMYDIRARRFVNGAPAGSDFVVNSTRAFSQSNPDVAIDSLGNFVVVWDSWFQDGSDRGVYAQRFDANGNRVGQEFQLNTTTAYSQTKPAIRYLSTGKFVTVWESWGQDAPGQAGYGVFGRVWNADGTPATGEFQVNTYTADYQWYAALTDLGPDGFAVCWCSWGEDGDEGAVYLRLFDGGGNPLTPEVPVNQTTAYYQWLPRVTRIGDNRLAVCWSSWKLDGSREGVYCRTFDLNGRPISFEEQLNQYTESFQWEPDIVATAGDDILAVWSTWGQVGKDYEIAARRVTPVRTQGVLSSAGVNHPFWRSTTRLVVHVYDSTALTGHAYEVKFDSLGGGKALVNVRNSVRGDTVVRGYPIDRGENVFYKTPTFDGLALEVIPEFDLDLDYRASYFVNRSGTNLLFGLSPPGAGSKLYAPIDIALVWGATDTLPDGQYVTPLDTAINVRGIRAVAVPFRAWNITDNQKIDLLVVDSDANNRWTPGERIVFRTPVPYRVATTNTHAEFSSSVPSGIVKLPGVGDTNYVFTTRPIRQGETFTFTASRSLVLDAPQPGAGAASFSLLQNFPNPFNPRTTIRYSIPATGRVVLTVYNILGQHVATLVDEVQGAGNYRVSFDGRQAASGVYFYRLEQGGRTVTQKMLMLK